MQFPFLFILKSQLCSKSFFTSGADNGVLSLSFGKSQNCLAMSTFNVSVAFEIANAVFLKNKKVFNRPEDLHEYLVFTSACPDVF